MLPWQSPEFDDHEQVCTFFDRRTGLRALAAIHSTALGPAVGGTRFRRYSRDEDALDDALRLSRAMSYKCALANVSLGGGKVVILAEPGQLKSQSLLHAYGHFLNRIGQQYSTGEDVGFCVADCETVREVSPFVAGTASFGAGDPSIHTARGVFHGLRAVLEARFDRADYRGVHFAVQGLGSVGWQLCKLLHEAGARLTVADIQSEKADRARTQFAATIVAPDAIYKVQADVYVPCALGGVINLETVQAIRAAAIAGAANNQLESPDLGVELRRRDILFAPDFVINAGGIIGAAEEIAKIPGRAQNILLSLDVRLQQIYTRLVDIFALAEKRNATPEATATLMARDLIGRRNAASDIQEPRG
jgi:leucine dehydrogenase